MLVTVKVPPLSSLGPILLSRVRAATSAMRLASPAMLRSSAFLDHRHQQPARGVHRDRQVHVAVVGHLLRLGVDRRVELGERLERFDGGLGVEGQEGQLDALAPLELGLSPGPQLGDPGDVDPLHRGQLRGDLQRLGHPLGDHLAQPRHLHGGTRLRAVGGRAGDGGRLARGRRGPAGRGLGGLGLGLRFRGGLLGGGQHVLLADPPADSGAADRGQVDVVLRGQLADQRRHVRGTRRTPAGGRVGRLGRGRGLAVGRGPLGRRLLVLRRLGCRLLVLCRLGCRLLVLRRLGRGLALGFGFRLRLGGVAPESSLPESSLRSRRYRSRRYRSRRHWSRRHRSRRRRHRRRPTRHRSPPAARRPRRSRPRPR